MYTTNSRELLNYQLRKIIKRPGNFSNDKAVVKLLWPAIRGIEDAPWRAGNLPTPPLSLAAPRC